MIPSLSFNSTFMAISSLFLSVVIPESSFLNYTLFKKNLSAFNSFSVELKWFEVPLSFQLYSEWFLSLFLRHDIYLKQHKKATKAELQACISINWFFLIVFLFNMMIRFLINDW
jgi:hypothetical protein